MGLKDLLVVVDNDPACASRIDVARRLAEAHEAHLTGLHVMPRPVPLYSDIPAPASVETMQRQELEQAAGRAAALFETRTRGTAAPTEWRVVEGHPLDIVTVHGRHADLVVLGQGRDLGEASADLSTLPADLVLAAGRPVLVVPRYGTFRSVGAEVLVAWDASREATRAVHDALPLLCRARKVTVLSIDPEDTGEPRIAGGDVALHLARHGVPVQAATLSGADIAVGDLLLSYGADHGIDLIVMGAYGHTRFRELILGGATRRLLQSMTVPVFMSH
jgi:nucleotide-binding universal stress UspA family protein